MEELKQILLSKSLGTALIIFAIMAGASLVILASGGYLALSKSYVVYTTTAEPQ